MQQSDEKNNNRNEYFDDDDDDSVAGKHPMPVVPKMLVKTLKTLRKRDCKTVFFSPLEVAREIHKTYPRVQHKFRLLLLEVTDKLICASAAGFIGNRSDLGYYAFDFRQESIRESSRSELMFWLFYQKILNRKKEEMKRQQETSNSMKNNKEMKRKLQLEIEKMRQNQQKKRNLLHFWH